jgi:hypothetical protein
MGSYPPQPRYRCQKQKCGRATVGSAAFRGGTNSVFVQKAGIARQTGFWEIAQGSDRCLRFAASRSTRSPRVSQVQKSLAVQVQQAPGAGFPRPTGSALDERHPVSPQTLCHLSRRTQENAVTVYFILLSEEQPRRAPLKNLHAN